MMRQCSLVTGMDCASAGFRLLRNVFFGRRLTTHSLQCRPGLSLSGSFHPGILVGVRLAL